VVAVEAIQATQAARRTVCAATRGQRRGRMRVKSSPAGRLVGTAEVPHIADGIAAVPQTVSIADMVRCLRRCCARRVPRKCPRECENSALRRHKVQHQWHSLVGCPRGDVDDLPCLRAIIDGAMCFTIRKGPRRLMAMTLSHCATSISASPTGGSVE
jgi:hypothetical protein